MGPELPLEEALARLLLVLVLAGAVGFERELRDRDAGLRTHMLVGVGAALFVIAGNFAWSGLDFGNRVGIVLDPSRVVAYVVTGVGFLGAGAILKSGAGVRGLTTAASLWVVAAIGVTVGSGLYWLGVFATAVVLLSLWPVGKLVTVLGLRSRRSARLVVELDRDGRVGDVVRALEGKGVEVLTTSVTRTDDSRRLVIDLAGSEHDVGELLDRVPLTAGVLSASTAG